MWKPITDRYIMVKVNLCLSSPLDYSAKVCKGRGQPWLPEAKVISEETPGNSQKAEALEGDLSQLGEGMKPCTPFL